MEQNTRINNYIAKYKNFVFLKLLENDVIDKYINKRLLINDLKKLNLFDEIVYIIWLYFYQHYFSTEGKLLCLLKYNRIKVKFINIIKRTNFISFYHSLNEKMQQKINILLFTKLNFSDYINVSQINNLINQDIYSFNNPYKIASKYQLLKTKIFSENILDKLEENFGIYNDSENFIEELNSEIKIKNKKKFLQSNDFINLIELNAYYSLYKKRSQYIRLWNFYGNNLEESLYEEIINIFYTCKKKKIDKIREIKINEKGKIKREKILIKNSYDKINNVRFNKYINKKNITRLLLCKRNYY